MGPVSQLSATVPGQQAHPLMFSCPDDMTFEQSRDCHRIRKQSPRSCDPCCVAEANEDVTLIITPLISRSDILLTSDTLEQSSACSPFKMFSF